MLTWLRKKKSLLTTQNFSKQGSGYLVNWQRWKARIWWETVVLSEMEEKLEQQSRPPSLKNLQRHKNLPRFLKITLSTQVYVDISLKVWPSLLALPSDTYTCARMHSIAKIHILRRGLCLSHLLWPRSRTYGLSGHPLIRATFVTINNEQIGNEILELHNLFWVLWSISWHAELYFYLSFSRRILEEETRKHIKKRVVV